MTSKPSNGLSSFSNTLSFTIAIPTYNRPKELLRTVERLSGQLNMQWTVLIIDNCSTVLMEETFEKIKTLLVNVAKLRVIRNIVNIGANANIVRCIELAESKWVWLLGDDDLPACDCVKMIESHCNDATNSFLKFICRDTQIWDFPKEIEKIEQSVEFGVTLGDWLFLSTCVVHGPSAKGCVYDMTQYAYSCAPHVVLVDALMKRGSGRLVDYSIVERGIPNQENTWSYFSVSLRMRTLLDYPWADKTRPWITREIQFWAMPWKGALRTCLTAFANNEISSHETAHLLRSISSYLPGIQAIFVFSFGFSAAKNPAILRMVAKIICLISEARGKKNAAIRCKRL